MDNIKNKILALLQENHSQIRDYIKLHIDIFSENELNQIYIIINQTDIEKLKELFLYQNSQVKNTLDRIISLAKELKQLDKHIENEQSKVNNEELDDFLEKNLNLNYSIS